MKNQRGFTLIELAVAMLILSVVVAGIAQVLIKQSQASNSQSLQRDLEESGRLALLEIARNVRLAGYGISPLAAFDFDRYGCTTPGSPATCNCTTANAKTTACAGGTLQRDQVGGPDEVVLSYRDLSFSRAIGVVTIGSPSSIPISPALKTALPRGTVVQLMSSGGGSINYMVLNAAAAANATSLQLTTVSAADGYYAPSTALNDQTYKGGSVMLVDRIRYFIANDTDGVPSLWKERGKGNELLYRGIEDLQISYDIGQPPTNTVLPKPVAGPNAACTATLTGGTDGWTYGTCTGVVAQPSETAVAPDWINDGYDSANRYTGHPANIRNVTISLVARGTRATPGMAGDPVPALGNRPARAADLFKRMVLQMDEQPQNLIARQTFAPIVVTQGLEKSVGGG